MDIKKRQNQNISRNEILKLPYLVLIVSMLFTVGATYVFYRNEVLKDAARFQLSTGNCQNRIDNKFRAYVGLLRAGRGFVSSNEHLNQESFADFFSSLEVEKNYPEISQLGFSKRIPPARNEEAKKKNQTERNLNLETFSLPAGATFQAPIYFRPESELNPTPGSFDLSVNPVYQNALEQAISTGMATTTGKVLVKMQGEKETPAFLVFMPIYQGGKDPGTTAERARLLEGFVYDAVNADSFLDEVKKTSGISNVAVAVFENEMQSANLVGQIGGDFQFDAKKLTASNQVTLANEKWVVGYQAQPSFQDQLGIVWTPAIFLTGIVFSLMLFGTTYQESYTRAKAEKTMSELRESEREKGFLLEREQNARHVAEESSRVKDEFISVVSHELRTPLNSIAGWSRILVDENLPESTKRKALYSIDKNVRLQTSIVEDLLDLSQLLSGSHEVDKQKVNISETFEEAFAEAAEAARKKGINLIRENYLHEQKIIGSAGQLKKVFKNLLANAIKFTPEGGEVAARLNEKNGSSEIKITDNGQGIKPEAMSGIFESFKQADSSITRTYGGLGLGLAIVRRIVELHGGHISARSEGEYKGSEFTVVLPINAS